MSIDVYSGIRFATILLNLTLSLAVGASVATLWLSPISSRWAAEQQRRIYLVRIVATALALAAFAVLLPLVSASMAEVPLLDATDATASMLTESHFGLAWTVGVVALLVALSLAVPSVPAPWRPAVARLTLLVLSVTMYSRSMVSHAAASGDLSVPVVIDWVHLCMIALWVGEVCIASFVIMNSPMLDGPADRLQLLGYVKKLSTSATFALVGIIATGLFSSWHNLGGVGALTASSYGNFLLVKLVLVATAVALGALNRWVAMPELITTLLTPDGVLVRPMGRFNKIMRIESVVLLGVLVVAAVLSATSPQF